MNRNPPSGQYRYYDGMLYFMALLHVSGEFRPTRRSEARRRGAAKIRVILAPASDERRDEPVAHEDAPRYSPPPS